MFTPIVQRSTWMWVLLTWMAPQAVALGYKAGAELDGIAYIETGWFGTSNFLGFATEGETAFCQIVRRGNTNIIVAAEYATSDGTARGGIDYVEQSGVLIFAPGECSRTFEVITLENGCVDGNRDFSFVLSNPSEGVEIPIDPPDTRPFGFRGVVWPHRLPTFTVFGNPGTSYVLERTSSIGRGDPWSTIATLTLTTTEQTVSDNTANAAENSFYRLQRVIR